MAASSRAFRCDMNLFPNPVAGRFLEQLVLAYYLFQQHEHLSSNLNKSKVAGAILTPRQISTGRHEQVLLGKTDALAWLVVRPEATLRLSRVRFESVYR